MMLKTRRSMLAIVAAAILSSTGGGTLREILLADGAVFWLEDVRYLLTVLLAIFCTLILPIASLTASARLKRLFELSLILATLVFIAVGVTAASTQNAHLAVLLAMGVLTGIGGGLLRDFLLFHRIKTGAAARLRLLTITILQSAMIVALLESGSSAVSAVMVVTTIHVTILGTVNICRKAPRLRVM